MILFVTGQYAGAQYIHPLINKWTSDARDKWQIVSTSTSCAYWDKEGINYIDARNMSGKSAKSILEHIRPTLIVLSASANISLEYEFIIAAREKGIPSANFIDIWSNYAARYNYNGYKLYPDYVLAIDSRCAEELSAAGVPDNIIRVIGQPYLEEVVNKKPALGKNTLIVSQPVNKFYQNKLGYDESIFRDICAKVESSVTIDNLCATYHPDESMEHDADNSVNKLRWIKGNGNIDVENSHTVIGMFSMQMIIGYLWGRKVASLQPGLIGNDPSPLSRWGLISRLENISDVIEFLKSPVRDENNYEFNAGFIGSIQRLESFCMGNY